MTTSNSPRLRRLSTVSLAVAAALGLSGCGNELQPGAAAIVNGEQISRDHVDEVVGAACAYTQVIRQQQGGAGEAQRLADLRSQLTTALIQIKITDELAMSKNVSASPAAVQKIAEQTQIPPELDDGAAETLKEFFSEFALSQAQQAAIGANARDPEVTSVSKVSPADIQAAGKVLADYTQKQDVVVNPGYGVWDGSIVAPASGSLSDPVSAAAKAAGSDPAAPQDPAAPEDPAAETSDVPAVQLCG